MKLTFHLSGWEDYLALQDGEPKAFKKLNGLIQECLRHPFTGTGKPEALKENLKGFWSRRISQEHRLIYRVSGAGDAQTLEIIQCRLHY